MCVGADTIQGGQGENAGLLPRVLHSVLASVRERQSSACLRPYGLSRVESIPSSERIPEGKLPGDVLAVAGSSTTRQQSASSHVHLAESGAAILAVNVVKLNPCYSLRLALGLRVLDLVQLR